MPNILKKEMIIRTKNATTGEVRQKLKTPPKLLFFGSISDIFNNQLIL